MRGTGRAVLVGVLLALLTGAVIGGAVFWWVQTRGPLAKASKPGRVVVVFAGPDEEGVQVAQVVAVLDTAKGTWTYPDPLEKVTVTGTNYDRLREAYPFGGAEAVAQALGLSRDDGWIDVPQEAWQGVVGSGVTVDVPQTMNVFDGARLVTFSHGSGQVSGRDLALLMNGAAYLSGGERIALTQALGRASIAALAASRGVLPAGAFTNMSPSALAATLDSAEASP